MNEEIKKAAPFGETEAVSMVLSQCKDNNNSADNQDFHGFYGDDFLAKLEERKQQNLKPAEEKISLHKEYSLPIWGLPTYAQDIINDVSEVRQCPRDFAVVAAISTAAAAAGKRVTSSDSYKNTPLLWFSIVAPSGTGKTQVLTDIMKPLREMDSASYAEWKEKDDEWERNEKNGREPTLKKIIINDSTGEVRNVILANNPDGCILFRDELAGCIYSLNSYHKGAEAQDLISIFSSQDINVDRKGSKSLLITEPFMSIIGGMQPEILPRVFSNELANDGFLQRFLFVYPDDYPRRKYSRKRLNENVMASWKNKIKQIHSLQPVQLEWNGKTEEIYADYFEQVEDKMESSESPLIRSILAKFQVQVIRWTVAVQSLHIPADGTLEITPETMRYSVECMTYFQHTAEKVGELISGGQPQRKVTDKEVISNFYRHFSNRIESKSALARLLKIPQPYISKILGEEKRE